MANKIIGKTDVSGAMNLGSVTSNSKRPVLLIGEGVDTTKEIVFKIRGTTDAAAHFGSTSPCNDIVKALILNGVKSIFGICVGDVGTDNTAPYNTSADAYAAAMDKSLVESEIMVVLLDTTDTDVHKKMADHLVTAESADIYRYGVVGVPAATTDADAVMALSKTLNSDRMFMGFPNVVDANNNVLDGCITAAGVAAVLNTQTDDPALPTNNTPMAGFGGVSDQITEDTMNKLADAGVTAIFPENGQPTIWRMVTTAQKLGDEEDAQHSIWHDGTTRLIADDVLGTVLAKLKANYKRTKNVTRVLDSIRTDVINVLDNKLALEIIEEYDPALVTVVKDPKDHYGALVDYEYKVVSPLYTITVTQHVKI